MASVVFPFFLVSSPSWEVEGVRGQGPMWSLCPFSSRRRPQSAVDDFDKVWSLVENNQQQVEKATRTTKVRRKRSVTFEVCSLLVFFRMQCWAWCSSMGVILFTVGVWGLGGDGMGVVLGEGREMKLVLCVDIAVCHLSVSPFHSL